ncbi:TIGR04255 family protein [Terrarubrum flagellatum]|uniref:TIGR04255 family protein n=1 Tax=Terrirubrum flagellatum TaxID=2895980 RepID=UPI00314514B2
MPWEPANEGHAIERVAASILFAEPLPLKVLRNIQESIKTSVSPKGFDKVVLLPSPTQFQIAIHGGQPSLTNPATGQAFRKVSDDAVVEEVISNESALTFAATRYQSWEAFISVAQECLAGAVASAASLVTFRDIRLEYWDRFDLKGRDGISTLINPRTTLLSEKFRSKEQSWHNNIGYFYGVVPQTRNLINANVGVVIHAELPVNEISGQARIYTLAATQSRIDEGAQPWQVDSWKAASGVLTDRHEDLKSVLVDIIHPVLSQKIKLTSNSAAP